MNIKTIIIIVVICILLYSYAEPIKSNQGNSVEGFCYGYGCNRRYFGYDYSRYYPWYYYDIRRPIYYNYGYFYGYKPCIDTLFDGVKCYY